MLKPFEHFTGVVAPLAIDNIDTDQIIPKQYLKSIERTGFGETLFDDWRYLESGVPGQDHSQRPINPDFILNQSAYREASILLTGANFGCGSSREHAPWALLQYGFRCIISASFADIFYNNSLKNGLLCVQLPKERVAHLLKQERSCPEPAFLLEIDLEHQQVVEPDGTQHGFDIIAFRKKCMLEGLDDIGLTLQSADLIKAYESKQRTVAPWLFNHTVSE